ncbi:DUF3226 domain-containing protein [Desulfosporosinus sp. FKB]|uniref:DUF3226 domain-containing protein n=1 Tax=Desulfosporosinus sp. FKB TaxID=1969835 RepID=UPI000B49A45D|nr:DUF3226 domain-containing protein [Desulfosporosinus sp. FKB]
MNSVILCEGIDDVLILGYFIHKISNDPKWLFDKKANISNNFKIRPQNRNEKIEIYTRGDDKIAIWCVGGKDTYDYAIKTICRLNTTFPKERFEEVIIFSDRDKDDISIVIKNIEDLFKANRWPMSLSNNKANLYEYEIENEIYQINVTPIIIPFESEGALETVLIQAIANTCEEDNFVVESAHQYIKEIVNSGNLSNYLQHDRLKLKAEFSSIISITNPDRSTASFNELLTSHKWEEKQEIRKHFQLIENTFK